MSATTMRGVHACGEIPWHAKVHVISDANRTYLRLIRHFRICWTYSIQNLSGGQRQRIAIAQALLSLDDVEKKIVLLDECTSNIDGET